MTLAIGAMNVSNIEIVEALLAEYDAQPRTGVLEIDIVLARLVVEQQRRIEALEAEVFRLSVLEQDRANAKRQP